jgi:hypothetical protein
MKEIAASKGRCLKSGMVVITTRNHKDLKIFLPSYDRKKLLIQPATKYLT